MVARLQFHTAPLPDVDDRDWWKTITDEQVAATSLDRWNLWCARDLPGSEEIDVEETAEQLNRAAAWAWHAREEYADRFHDDPAEFRRSIATWCAYVVLWGCQSRFGVKYREEWRQAIDHDDSRKLFLNGVVGLPDRPALGGTCANVPLVYVAVGRRLGYPLRVVRSYNHVWCRWDDPHGHSGYPPDVFNVEGTGGYGWPSDEHFRKLDHVDPRHEANGWYLKSLTPKEEVGSFHLERGYVLERTGRIHEAQEAFTVAAALWRPNGRVPEEIRDGMMRTAALLGLPLVPHDDNRLRGQILQLCELHGWEYTRKIRPADPRAFFPDPARLRRPFRVEADGTETAARRHYDAVRDHHHRHGLNVALYDVPALRERGLVPDIEHNRRFVDHL